MQRLSFTDVDSYISEFPESTQKLLGELRATILAAAPEAQESISYHMPAYKYQGVLVYFAGYKNHIGFYPTPSGIAAFREELAGYKSSKGAVQFPLGQPLPLELIRRIVVFRMEENRSKKRP